MMGTHRKQKSLFAYNFDLDERVPSDHPLRKVLEKVDFSFIREEVRGKYGYNGHVGLDPEVILKLMFLLFWDNVPSERELIRSLPLRLDYLWFIGYDVADAPPHHSVLSKARARWGGELFETMFVRSVSQCVEAGLVGGEKLHMDGSHIDANASRDSVFKGDPEMVDHLRRAYGAQEAKLELAKGTGKGKEPQNRRLLSKSDPDTACVRKKSGGESRPRYKAHRAVDDERGVIVATETTAGDVEENAMMKPLLEQGGRNVGSLPGAVVADSQYGTAENYRDATAMGVAAHMAPYGRNRESKIYGPERFRYAAATDTYSCPRGEKLYPRRPDKIRMGVEYVARKGTCAACPLKGERAGAKSGRTLLRRWGQELIDEGMATAASPQAKASRRRRKWLMEGSFAQSANHHGFKRSRWRRLWRQRIQDHMICAVQNVRILISAKPNPQKAARAAESAALSSFLAARSRLYWLTRSLMPQLSLT